MDKRTIARARVSVAQPVMGIDTLIINHVAKADKELRAAMALIHAPKRKAIKHGLTGFVEYFKGFFA